MKGSDGDYTIRFGGDPAAPNFLRIYRPGPSVLDGSYTLPKTQPA